MRTSFEELLTEYNFTKVEKKENKSIFGHVKLPIVAVVESNHTTIIGYTKLNRHMICSATRWQQILNQDNQSLHRNVLRELSEIEFCHWPIDHTKNSILENQKHLFSLQERQIFDQEDLTMNGADLIKKIEKRTKVRLTKFSFDIVK